MYSMSGLNQNFYFCHWTKRKKERKNVIQRATPSDSDKN